MFNLVSFDRGTRRWAKASNMARRLGRSRSRPVDSHDEQDPGPACTDDTSAAAATRWVEAKARREKDKLPLAITILDNPGSVDRQSDCPLFAKLPAELREVIWNFALTRYEVPGTCYPLHKPCARPGQAGPLRVAVELLLTCRAVYLETFLIPFRVNPWMVFDGHPDVVPPQNVLQCTPSNLYLSGKMRPWQFANITSVVMSVQQFTLEGGSVERVSRLAGNKGRHQGHEAKGISLVGYASFGPPKETKSVASDTCQNPGNAENRSALIRNIFTGQKITRLTIHMSRTDWWTWASRPQDDPHERLRLEPMMNITDRRDTSSAMEKGYEARKEGQQPDFNLDDFEKLGRWGMQFAEHWPDLQQLELALEMYDIKEDQLDSVIKCAKIWTFPLGEGRWLEWDGRKESIVRWRGAPRYDYDDALGLEWVNDRVPTRETRKDNTPLIRWRPEDNDDLEEGCGQEFVMKSLVFTRRCGPADSIVV